MTDNTTLTDLLDKIADLTKRVEDLEDCCSAHNKVMEQKTKRHENVVISFNGLCPLIDEIFDAANPPSGAKYECYHDF